MGGGGGGGVGGGVSASSISASVARGEAGQGGMALLLPLILMEQAAAARSPVAQAPRNACEAVILRVARSNGKQNGKTVIRSPAVCRTHAGPVTVIRFPTVVVEPSTAGCVSAPLVTIMPLAVHRVGFGQSLD